MTEHVQIALIIVAGIVAILLVALWKFNKLGRFIFTASKKSVTAKMEQHQNKNTGINISGNIQDGNDNEITAETANAAIENNRQQGDENLIRAAVTSKNNKKKSWVKAVTLLNINCS